MLISPAFAQSAGGSAGIGQLLPFLLIFVVFYFFLIRPQQRRAKEHKAMIAAIKRGDKIIQVNNEQISSASHLINYVALQAPGSLIDVIVEREGKQQALQVKVGERKVQQNTQSQYIPLPKHP